MAFPTTKRIKGRQVVPTCNGERSDWDKIGLKLKVTVENPQGADADFVQKIIDLKDANGTISGFLGDTNNIANLPQPGDEITDLDFAIADTSMFPPELLDAAQRGKWRVVDADYESSKDSAKWSLSIEAGFID